MPTTVLQPPTRTPSAIGISSPPNRKPKQKPGKSRSPSARRESVDADTEASNKLKQQVLSSVKTLSVAEGGEGGVTERSGVSSGDEDVVKRRGKKKRGKKGSRDNGREGEREFQGIPDPGETQVFKHGMITKSCEAECCCRCRLWVNLVEAALGLPWYLVSCLNQLNNHPRL